MKFVKIIPVLLFLLAGQALAETAVIVHPSNGDSLSAQDISQLFLGKSKAFPSGSAAVPYNLPEGDAARSAFQSEVLGREDSQLKAYWSKQIFTGKGNPPKELSAAELKAKVAGDPQAIGYIDAGQVDGSVKAVMTF
jgi:ABC-type phosphate transport system substrate-binding protein